MSTISAPKPGRRTRVRWLMAFLAFAAITLNYVDRANLSVALPYISKELHLSAGAKGLLLGAFFWTYAAFQLPLGWAVDRLGNRIVFAAAVAWWSIFTAATAAARSVGSLLGLRLVLGVGEAGAFPACTQLVEQWFPRHERATASGIYDSGARGGTMLAIPIVTALIAAVGWRGSFLITGALGLVWVALWLWLYRNPRQHPRISAEELAYIEAGGARTSKEPQPDRGGLRWRDLLRYRTVWGMALGYSCQSFIIYFFITWFPSYLVDQRGFSLLELGFFGTLPGLVALAGNLVGGWVSDALVRRGVGLTLARKSCIVGGLLVSTLISVAAIVPNAAVALVLLSISFGGVTFATTSIVTLPADIAPETETSRVGSIQGIQNSVANLAGIASPVVIGFIYGATGSFTGGLFAAGAVALAGCVFYIFVVGKIEPLATGSPAEAPEKEAHTS